MSMNTMDLHALVTDHTAEVYWDKPDAARPEERYEVLLDGAAVTEAARTHATLENLTPDTEYTALVTMGDGRLPLGSVRFRTGKTRRRIDVTAAPYHALGDGRTLNTAALQRAMDDCGEDQCVYFPAGVYLTGALRLHSHMEVYLEEGAVLQGTEEPADYLPRILSRFEGTELMCYASLLNLGELDHAAGPGCEDVLIHGRGTIASGGRTLARRIIEDERIRLKDDLAALGDKILECENLDTIPGRVRPRLINMSNCRHVRISGLTLANGASWNVHMIYSDHIVTDHCVFRSEGVWNGDGWDPDSSEDCTLFACRFFTGDDAVAIKSGKNPEGNLINRPSRRIRVFDCESAFGHGVTIGSEMSGGVEDVRIWDCDLGRGMYGIEIKGTKKRGGYVRGVHMRDCTVARVLMHAVGYNDDGVGAPLPPKFSDCSFERVRILGRALNHEGETLDCPAIELQGFDVPGYEVENVTFRDCVIDRGSDVKMHRCRSIALGLSGVE